MSESGQRRGGGFIIQRAETEDIPELVQLELDARAELASLAPEGYGAALQKRVPENEIAYELQSALEDPSTTVLIALKTNADGEASAGGRALAYCRLWFEENSDALIEAPYLTIEQIAVTPEARGEGLARALLAAAESVAAGLNARGLELSVLETNTVAQQLYASLGYSVLERRMGKLLEPAGGSAD